MTSYKKLAEELDEKLTFAVQENETLRMQLAAATQNLVDEMIGHMRTQDARDALSAFSDRARNREELVLLIRALSNLK